MRLLFGICGYKGSGKSSLARAIKDHIAASESGSALIVSFAQPIRGLCRDIFELSTNEMTSRELKEEKLHRWPFMSPREIMQKVGTECFRDHFPGVWTQLWRRRAVRYLTEGWTVITPDYRFLDEAGVLRAEGAKLIRVDRLGCQPDGHESESQVERLPHDIVVYNSQDSVEAFQKATIAELVSAGFLPRFECAFKPGDLVTHTADGAVGEVVSIEGELVEVDWLNIGKYVEPSGVLRPRAA
jgi:hypothetical protein